jgi:hypothetical protein
MAEHPRRSSPVRSLPHNETRICDCSLRCAIPVNSSQNKHKNRPPLREQGFRRRLLTSGRNRYRPRLTTSMHFVSCAPNVASSY